MEVMDAVGFTQKDVANASDKIWEQTLEKNNFPNSVDSPKAFIWGGGPGAGKSSSMGIVSRKYLNDNALVIFLAPPLVPPVLWWNSYR